MPDLVPDMVPGPVPDPVPARTAGQRYPSEQWLYVTPDFIVGQFKLAAIAPEWGRENQIGSPWPIVAFPTVPVWITHEGGEPFVADPSVAVLYRPRHRYRRGLVDATGDACVYLTFSPRLARGIWAEFDPTIQDRAELSFGRSTAAIEPGTYFRHAWLARRLRSGVRREPRPEHLAVEETVHDLLRRTASGTWPDRGSRPLAERGGARRRRATARAHHELVQHARSLLSGDYAARLGLADVAAAVHVSPYHLARLFRDHTGMTMHSYRTRMRVLAGLRRLANPKADLTELAVELGFADHSHFSNSFRRVLGVPPSAVRSGHFETSTILQA